VLRPSRPHLNLLCLVRWIRCMLPLLPFPLRPSPMVFPTGPRDAVVGLLGIPSRRRSARIVSSESLMDANAATGEGPPAKVAVGTAAVTRTDEGSPTKDAIGTAMVDRMDTEPVLQVPSSTAKNVRHMGAQSSKSIDRLTGKQTPTRRAKPQQRERLQLLVCLRSTYPLPFPLRSAPLLSRLRSPPRLVTCG
jgi:hypothetical protein